MTEILQFPALNARQALELEQMFRAVLVEAGCDVEMIKSIIDDIMPRLRDTLKSIDIAVPVHPNMAATIETVSKLKSFFQGVTSALVGQMLVLEVELYVARRWKPNVGAGIAEKIRNSGLPFLIIEGGKGGGEGDA